METADILTAIRQELAVSLPKGGQAVLYGSRARGDYHAWSDWDILILLPDDAYARGDYNDTSYNLWKCGLGLGAEINAVTYSASEWKANSSAPFHIQVSRDGVPLLAK